MEDINEEARKRAIKEWSDYVDSFEERLALAKENLGERWILHPSNRVNKRLSPYGSIK